MNRKAAGLLYALGLFLPGLALPADPTPTPAPGWTGLTDPKAVITARQELMEHIELLMEPIDTITIRPVRDVARLHSNAEVIGAMLTAVPHLFPPTTNRYDPQVLQPETIALPEIWKSFQAFYGLAGAAVQAAEAMALAEGTQNLRAASRRLRAACEACHAIYLRKYEPPKVLDSDYRFDFNSAIGRK
ncbi:MAG: Cytochrome [Pseudomonadota bacterium]